MENTSDVEQAVKNEFTAYYLLDEFPPQWDESFLESDIPERAARSAIHFKDALNDEQISSLVDSLHAASTDPTHPMVSIISAATQIDWVDPENWPVLQTLLAHIVENLHEYDSPPNLINIVDIEQSFEALSWTFKRLDDTSIQANFSEGNLVLPVIAQIEEPLLRFLLFPFPDAALDDEETDYRRLMQIGSSDPVVKLLLGDDNELVTSVEHVIASLDGSLLTDTVTTSIDMLFNFVRSSYEDIVAAVTLIDTSDAEEIE